VAAIGDEAVVAPDLLGPEVLSTLRGLERGDKLTVARAETALRRLERAPVQTIKTGNLLGRAWELRHNLSAYDACYVALAEVLGARLVTADGHSPRCQRSPYSSRSCESGPGRLR
jgi:predicted nucleic acid-binding protein